MHKKIPPGRDKKGIAAFLNGWLAFTAVRGIGISCGSFNWL